DRIRDVDVVSGGFPVDDRLCGRIGRVDAEDDRVRDVRGRGRRGIARAAAATAAARGEGRDQRREREQREKTLHGLPSCCSRPASDVTLPPYVERAAAVSSWKWAISCSLSLMRTPCPTAPEATPRCTLSTSTRCSRPTWSSKVRSSSI